MTGQKVLRRAGQGLAEGQAPQRCGLAELHHPLTARYGLAELHHPLTARYGLAELHHPLSQFGSNLSEMGNILYEQVAAQVLHTTRDPER